MIESSKTSVLISLSGTEYEFSKLKPVHILAAIERETLRLEKHIIALVPEPTVQDARYAAVEARKVWSIDKIDEVFEDLGILVEVLYQSFRSRNPEATREEFHELMGIADLAIVNTLVDKLTPGGAADEDPFPATAEPETTTDSGSQSA